MDAVTLIVDASLLIDRIHGLKQWIYDGSVRVVVPLCTLNEVERLYKASIAAKEAPKEQVAKKASGRASRREEQPLFDINPRTTWEFLLREREKNDPRVVFQKEGEEFSPWQREGDDEDGESQPEPPSSFAEALLRKLNITNGSNQSTNEDEPKLLSRALDPKSHGAHPKIPKVPRKTVPSNLQPFFSFALWKIFESDVNASIPVSYEIFANDSHITNTAKMLGITACNWARLWGRITGQNYGVEERLTYGQLEREFPSQQSASSIAALDENNKASDIPNKDDNGSKLHSGTTVQETIVNESAPVHENGKAISASELSAHVQQQNEVEHPGDALSGAPDAQESNASEVSNNTKPATEAAVIKPFPKANNRADSPTTKVQEDSDLDSDEEIIVFNPRAKRGSWRPKTPGGGSEAAQSRPTTANGPKSVMPESPQPAKSPIKSSLKPQSPVFTPGQLYSSGSALAENAQSTDALVPTNNSPSRNPKGPARSPVLAHSKPDQTKSQTGNAKSRQAPTNDDRRQQSEIIIQRQREAIHRQANALQKPLPRRVQKEPTDNPTIIDPDAFDRSYVVQPPTQSTNERGGKRRSGPKPKHGSKGNAQQANAPKAEPDTDFVLKSGAPRGSTRGKGKLFVP